MIIIKLKYNHFNLKKNNYVKLPYLLKLLIMQKKKNYNDLFFLNLHYPFLMLFFINKDFALKKNNDLKYLFPLLITKKFK
jgi:hypothetical protein